MTPPEGPQSPATDFDFSKPIVRLTIDEKDYTLAMRSLQLASAYLDSFGTWPKGLPERANMIQETIDLALRTFERRTAERRLRRGEPPLD